MLDGIDTLREIGTLKTNCQALVLAVMKVYHLGLNMTAIVKKKSVYL